MNTNPISRACEALGGRAALALALGVSPSFVAQLISGARPVPAERCPAIEAATGGAVTRRDLRPEDWWVIWPELVTDEYPAGEGEGVAAHG